MTREEVLTIFDKLLDNNQDAVTYDATIEELLARVAYNNGLIDMRDAIIIQIENENNNGDENL